MNIATTNSSGGYSNVSETSFSGPVVAGVVALVRAANLNVGPADAHQILMSSVDDLGAAGYDIDYGWGSVMVTK